jgi:hypothetical protein
MKIFSFKNCIIFTLSFLIYTYFFYKLGNTLWRTNSKGNKSFSLLPLFTEGLIGPIRSLLLILIHGNLFNAMTFLWFELFRLSNPFSAFLFVSLIYKLFTNV